MSRSTEKSSGWQTLTSEVVHKNPWFYIQRDKVRYPNGQTGRYYILKRYGPFIAIVAWQEGRVLMINQYRQTIRQKLWELPMGAVEEGESAVKAGQRELLEETGYEAGQWTKVGSFYVGPGVSNQKGIVFLAEDLKRSTKTAQGEPGELIDQLEWRDDSTVAKQIFNGKIKDGPTITAYFMTKKFLKEKGKI